ncbi:MAG: hypothetical protein PHU61_04635, partial [Candidatus Absconditabacteria bacterium]|nr:hypothetical protein [Candidatus Absconditabacteria bacterium]
RACYILVDFPECIKKQPAIGFAEMVDATISNCESDTCYDISNNTKLMDVFLSTNTIFPIVGDEVSVCLSPLIKCIFKIIFNGELGNQRF